MPEDLIQSLVHFLLALSGLGSLGSGFWGPSLLQRLSGLLLYVYIYTYKDFRVCRF